jgi:glycosyltransferase involved in cell wall biosynthesis
MKNISIIGTVGVPACYGGFESLVENLLDYTPADIQYTVFCTSKKYKEQLKTYKKAKLVYLNRDANGKDSILYDFESMKQSLGSDIMLILGVSGCIFLPLIRHHYKGKIITNIDGLEWRRDKWNWYAKKFLKFSEAMAVKYSDVVIGDNKGISDYVEKEYGRKAELIAYGGDQVHKVIDDKLYDDYPFCRKSYAVTVCRIEPENNIEKILKAFSTEVSVSLVIVGNWDSSEYGKELKKQYSKCSNINILDSIYEPHRINWIRSNASVYIHGHSAGGTNPSLVEAMNFGLPIFAFDCIYNRATTEEKALYWSNSEALKKLLQNTGDEELKEIAFLMEERGHNLYSWKHIAVQYSILY